MPRFTLAGQRRRFDEQCRSVLDYFSTPEHWNPVYELLKSDDSDDVPGAAQSSTDSGGDNGAISLRLLDFLVTTYAKHHPCQYQVSDADGQMRTVNIYHSAQTQLSGLHKKSMDPFKRRNKCAVGGGVFEFGIGERLVHTTMAQLVFFRWVLRNQVHHYAQQHLGEIRDAMAEHARAKRTAAVKRRDARQPRQRGDKRRRQACDTDAGDDSDERQLPSEIVLELDEHDAAAVAPLLESHSNRRRQPPAKHPRRTSSRRHTVQPPLFNVNLAQPISFKPLGDE